MSDLIQSGFDYGVLPSDVALKAQLAANSIKLRLKRTVEDIIEIGRELTAVKAELPHGQFLPWIAAEFEMSKETAQNFLSVYERFGGKNVIITNLKPTVLYALAAPSTPDEVIEKAVAKGADTKVSDVKDWKAELEAERHRREAAEKVLFEEQQRCREFGKESNERRIKIRELEQQIGLLKAQPKPEPEVIEKEVIPADYETAKQQAAALQAQTANLQKQLDDLKKQQNKLVNDQVKAKLQGYQSELDEMEVKKRAVEEQVERMKAYMASLNSEVKRIEVHQDVIEKSRLELISLAAFLTDLDPMNDQDTVKRWLALAQMHEEASTTIRLVFGNHSLEAA